MKYRTYQRNKQLSKKIRRMDVLKSI